MRILSDKRKEWLDARSREGSAIKAASRERHAEKIRLRRAGVREHAISVYQHGELRAGIATQDPKPAPGILSLLKNWEETANFLNGIRDSLNQNLSAAEKGFYGSNRRSRRSKIVRIQSYWDFSTIQEMSIPVALMLASEYDRARGLNGWAPRAVNIERWDPGVLTTLRQIGFLELCGVETRSTDALVAGGAGLLKMRRGRSSDGQAIADHLAAIGIDLTQQDPRLHEAIMEAVTNTVHHAYRHEELCPPFTVKAWWLTAAATPVEGGTRLQIVVYDQGASIPGTLPLWERYPTLERLLRQMFSADERPSAKDSRYDASAIQLALDIGRSSTERGYRGKGLNQIVSALELSRGGSIAIYSRCGFYRLTKGKEPQSVNNPIPIAGTLITWDLTI